MSIKQMNPTTPGMRGMTSQDFSAITTKKPLKSLTITANGPKGRNNQGRITTRHKGGGVKTRIRIISFALPANTKATVEEIEYDPKRSSRIARIKDQNGQYHYVLHAGGMQKGQTIQTGPEAPIEVGNILPLVNIPLGAYIYGIELKPGRGAQLVRSAGAKAQLVSKDGEYVSVKLPSGEIRMILGVCTAIIGVVGNEQHQNVKIGSAGRKRKMGVRPSVRGVVMNAVDHPHGGGDGGRHRMARAPVSPWGTLTLGYKTRNKKKISSNFIVKTRHQAKRRKG